MMVPNLQSAVHVARSVALRQQYAARPQSALSSHFNAYSVLLRQTPIWMHDAVPPFLDLQQTELGCDVLQSPPQS
jgi:hypothetical protein